MSDEGLSGRGRRIVAALKEFADDLKAGVPIESKFRRRIAAEAEPATASQPAGVTPSKKE